MQQFSKALFLILIFCILTSCSRLLGSYDGPIVISHEHIEGVSPGNAELYNERTYPTVQANWPGPGGDKLWLAVNLGASTSPENSVDDNPAAAGWYFQFNRKQGFYHNGTNITPQWREINIDENSSWEIKNDPCRLLLKGSWRLPTIEEMRAFRTAPVSQGGMGEGNRTSAFNSTLKLHSAGKLHGFDGDLEDRGISGNYWASDQFSDEAGEILGFSVGSKTFAGNKSFGRSVRCIQD